MCDAAPAAAPAPEAPAAPASLSSLPDLGSSRSSKSAGSTDGKVPQATQTDEAADDGTAAVTAAAVLESILGAFSTAAEELCRLLSPSLLASLLAATQTARKGNISRQEMARAMHTFLSPLLRVHDDPDGGTEEHKDGVPSPPPALSLPLPDRAALADAIRTHAGLLLTSWADRHGLYIHGVKALFDFVEPEGVAFEFEWRQSQVSLLRGTRDAAIWDRRTAGGGGTAVITTKGGKAPAAASRGGVLLATATLVVAEVIGSLRQLAAEQATVAAGGRQHKRQRVATQRFTPQTAPSGRVVRRKRSLPEEAMASSSAPPPPPPPPLVSSTAEQQEQGKRGGTPLPPMIEQQQGEEGKAVAAAAAAKKSNIFAERLYRIMLRRGGRERWGAINQVYRDFKQQQQQQQPKVSKEDVRAQLVSALGEEFVVICWEEAKRAQQTSSVQEEHEESLSLPPPPPPSLPARSTAPQPLFPDAPSSKDLPAPVPGSETAAEAAAACARLTAWMAAQEAALQGLVALLDG